MDAQDAVKRAQQRVARAKRAERAARSRQKKQEAAVRTRLLCVLGGSLLALGKADPWAAGRMLDELCAVMPEQDRELVSTLCSELRTAASNSDPFSSDDFDPL